MERAHSHNATICSSPSWWRRRIASHLRRRLVFYRHRRHDPSRLFRKIHGGADDHHGFDSFRLEGRHVEQGIAAHADANGPAARDAEMMPTTPPMLTPMA